MTIPGDKSVKPEDGAAVERPVSGSRYFPFFIIIILFLAGMIIMFRPSIHSDGQYYYAYLTSLFFDGDLDTYDELLEHAGKEKILTETGLGFNPYAVGTPLLWSPWFLAGHLITVCANALGADMGVDGYSAVYVFMIGLGSAVYALLGLFLIYRAGLRFLPGGPLLRGLAGVWWGASLPVYMYANPSMAHAASFFACSLFIFLVLGRKPEERTWIYWMIIGASAGLMALIRTQNVLLVFILIYEAAVLIIPNLKQAEKLRIFPGYLLAAVCSVIVFLPQLIVFKIIHGHWIINAYKLYPHPSYQFELANIVRFPLVLFSPQHGLFYWSPLLIFSFIGLFLLRRKLAAYWLIFILVFLAEVGMISCWGTWWGGASFGARFFINIYPLFILGLAAFLAGPGSRLSVKGQSAGIAVFVVWNFILMYQYGHNLIDREGPVGLPQVLGNIWGIF